MEEINQLQSSLKRTIDDLTNELLSLRGGRPTVSLFENVEIEAYNTPTPLKQLSTITLTPPREVTITFWDPSLTAIAAKTLNESMGINPTIDGSTLHLNIPPLTEERRLQLAKLVRESVEKARINIRSLRDNVNKKIEQLAKEGKLTEDEKFKAKADVQKAIDTANQSAEELLNKKISELRE
jgi:ribosome recycling factor